MATTKREEFRARKRFKRKLRVRQLWQLGSFTAVTLVVAFVFALVVLAIAKIVEPDVFASRAFWGPFSWVLIAAGLIAWGALDWWFEKILNAFGEIPRFLIALAFFAAALVIHVKIG